MSLKHLALGPGKTVVLVPAGLKHWSDSSWWIPTPQNTAETADQNTTPLSCEKRHLLVLEPQSKGHTLGLLHTKRPQTWSQGMQARGHDFCALPWSCYNLTVSPRNELIHYSGAPVFPTVTKETLAHCLVWRPAGFTAVVPQDCIYLCSLFFAFVFVSFTWDLSNRLLFHSAFACFKVGFLLLQSLKFT